MSLDLTFFPVFQNKLVSCLIDWRKTRERGGLVRGGEGGVTGVPTLSIIGEPPSKAVGPFEVSTKFKAVKRQGILEIRITKFKTPKKGTDSSGPPVSLSRAQSSRGFLF